MQLLVSSLSAAALQFADPVRSQFVAVVVVVVVVDAVVAMLIPLLILLLPYGSEFKSCSFEVM